MTVEDAPAVVVVGAGPTGTTVATLLAQYGIHCLLLDRWAGVYRQPRAVHLDDEIYRVIARLGIAGEFAAISRPAQGLRLLDPTMKVLAEFRRDTSLSVNGFPQANMFDQPELETLLRANLERYACVELRATPRSPASPSNATAGFGSPTSTAPTVPLMSSTPTTCSAATAPTASCAPTSALICTI